MTGTMKPTARAMVRTPAAILAAALAAGLLALSARADTITDGDQVSVRASDIARPGRGMTMQAVEAKFGAPQQRHAAVGEPPIARWDYPGFSVFFEKDRVIHAVVGPPADDSAPAASP
jgi:hypothetical protein